VTGFELREQLADFLRRVLQVGVECVRHIEPAAREAGEDRRAAPKFTCNRITRISLNNTRRRPAEPPEEVGKLLAQLEAVTTTSAPAREPPGPLVAAHRLALRELDSRARDAHQDGRPRLHAARLRRDVVDAINSTRENVTFIPALASLYAANPTEIEVRHDERVAGCVEIFAVRLIA